MRCAGRPAREVFIMGRITLDMRSIMYCSTLALHLLKVLYNIQQACRHNCISTVYIASSCSVLKY